MLLSSKLAFAAAFMALSIAPWPELLSEPDARAANRVRVLWVAPDLRHPGQYSFAHVRGHKRYDRALACLPLTAFGDGVALGGVQVRRAIKAEGEGACVFPDRLEFKGADPKFPERGVFVAAFDLNPGARYSRREASAQERDGLFEAATALTRSADFDLDAARVIGEVRRTGVNTAKGRHRSGLDIFVDRDRPGLRWALMTLDAALPATRNGSPEQVDALVLFVSDDGQPWRSLFARGDSTCTDCDDRPVHKRFVDFGDVDRDGHPDFLFELSYDKGWSYGLLQSDRGDWKQEWMGGGGGC
jgi:hypothetical protein